MCFLMPHTILLAYSSKQQVWARQCINGIAVILESLNAAGLAEQLPIPGRDRDRGHSFPHPKQVSIDLPYADLTHLLHSLKIGFCWLDPSANTLLHPGTMMWCKACPPPRTAALWFVWQQGSTSSAFYSCGQCAQS